MSGDGWAAAGEAGPEDWIDKQRTLGVELEIDMASEHRASLG